jgi:ribosomal protein L7/L12
MINLSRILMLAVLGAKKTEDKNFLETTITAIGDRGISIMSATDASRLQEYYDENWKLKSDNEELRRIDRENREENIRLVNTVKQLQDRITADSVKSVVVNGDETIVRIEPIDGQNIETIKTIRSLTGLGLRESKNFVDAFNQYGTPIVLRITKAALNAYNPSDYTRTCVKVSIPA